MFGFVGLNASKCSDIQLDTGRRQITSIVTFETIERCIERRRNTEKEVQPNLLFCIIKRIKNRYLKIRIIGWMQ